MKFSKGKRRIFCDSGLPITAWPEVWLLLLLWVYPGSMALVVVACLSIFVIGSVHLVVACKLCVNHV